MITNTIIFPDEIRIKMTPLVAKKIWGAPFTQDFQSYIQIVTFMAQKTM